MNYYIQGNAANADKIKAAFEKLGIDVLDFGFADKTVVYCSIGGACVQSLPYSINLMHILYSHPDYQELELAVESKFKVHDWVVDGDRVAIIYDLQKNGYVGHDINRKDFVCKYSDEGRLHLWTIADAKDGDVLVDSYSKDSLIILYKGINKEQSILAHCGWNGYNFSIKTNGLGYGGLDNTNYLPATKEQRDLLFAKMREAGYEWDKEKKELLKIKHYAIANFQSFDKVLVRQDDSCTWGVSFFGRYAGMFMCCNNVCFAQCIPFEGNEHLLGTTDMPSEEYINW